MKKLLAIFIVLSLLCGCGGNPDGMDRLLDLRAKLLGMESCSFDARITADYGDAVHSFVMHCQGDNQGNLTFGVKEPESISGITGEFAGGEGKLTFDDAALSFPLLTDEQITPVSGPWIFLKTLLGGYLTSCGEEEEYLRCTINDDYEDDALQLDIWLSGENTPVRAEIGWDGRRIVTMEIANFAVL